MQKNYEIIVEGEVISLLAYLNRISDSPDDTKKKKHKQFDKIRAAIEYLHLNIKNEIAVEDVCEAVGLGTAQLSRLFVTYTGKTMIDYLNHVRCQYARNLFLTGNYSVRKCAEMCGFNNMSYFARKYRQIYGETLSETNNLLDADRSGKIQN